MAATQQPLQLVPPPCCHNTLHESCQLHPCRRTAHCLSFTVNWGPVHSSSALQRTCTHTCIAAATGPAQVLLIMPSHGVTSTAWPGPQHNSHAASTRFTLPVPDCWQLCPLRHNIVVTRPPGKYRAPAMHTHETLLHEPRLPTTAQHSHIPHNNTLNHLTLTVLATGHSSRPLAGVR